MLATAVEMTELLYCDPTKRTSQSILRLHNVAFVHAKLCLDHFSNPKTMSSRRMFGRYFHALTTHSPLLTRIIAPRLLNTEMEERMFGQCKAITRNTSNQHANDIITNILVRIQYEDKRVAAETNTVKNQESEVLKLAQALRGKENTVIPMEWLQHMSVHYQAHLERISDYLLQGPGIWWQYVEDGVEFSDVNIHHPQLQTQTPSAHHFRSLTLGDVDTYLLSKWEQCQEEKIELPAQYIRTYQTNGDSNSIISNPVSLIPCSSREPGQPAQLRSDLHSHSLRAPHVNPASLLRSDLHSHSLRAPHMNPASLLRSDLHSHSLRAPHVNPASLLRSDLHSHSLRAPHVNPASLLRSDLHSHSLRAPHVNPASLLRSDLHSHSLRAPHVNPASLLRSDHHSHLVPDHQPSY